MTEEIVTSLENQEREFVLEECVEHGPCPYCGSVDLEYIIKTEAVLFVNIEKGILVNGKGDNVPITTTIKCTNKNCKKILNDIPNNFHHLIIN